MLYFSLIKCINKKNRMYKKLIKHWTTENLNFIKNIKIFVHLYCVGLNIYIIHLK